MSDAEKEYIQSMYISVTNDLRARVAELELINHAQHTGTLECLDDNKRLRADNAHLRNLLREIIDGATFDNYAYYTVEIDLDGYNAVREALGDE